MDKDLIEKYKREMLEFKQKAVAAGASAPAPPSEDSSLGGLIVSVTTLRELFPVKNAVVTVFTGSGDNITELDRDLTDESGRTKKFILSTPLKSLSQTAGSSEIPYALYNITVRSDGFVDYIETDIPVFPDTVSLQTADLTPMNAAGKNPQPRPFSDFPKFDL
ncbi:MAG: hypothetical protein IJZ75_06920 [Clostridia bacterium]|nr:hypothetical protein [Clostridia bacterium]